MTNKLKGVRVSRGHTQESISKQIGMTTKTYNRKELGLVEFSRSEIIKIANTLELTSNQAIEIFFGNELTKWLNKTAS